MSPLSDTFEGKISFINKGLTGGLLSPNRFDNGTTYGWILSSNITPQPVLIRGIWMDDKIWSDTNVWYD